MFSGDISDSTSSVVLSQTHRATQNEDRTYVINPQDFDKIFEHLCSQIRALSSKISNENESTATIIDGDTVLNEPKNVLHNMLTLIKQLNGPDYPHFYTQVLFDLLVSMLNEEKSCKNAFGMLQTIVEISAEDLKCCQKDLALLKARVSKPRERENKVKTKFAEAVNKEFRECKNDLKTVLEIMYPNDPSVKDVLSELIDNAPIDNEETAEIKWYDISKVPDLLPIIEVFDDACIITRHDDHINLIRLII